MIRTRKLSQLSSADRSVLMRRAQADIEQITPRVQEMADKVKAHGDEALTAYVKEFDFGEGVPFTGLKVTEEEAKEAAGLLSPEVREAIDAAYANIRAFHEKQLPEPIWFAEVSPGVFAGEKATPIERVACYVPGGKGYFPSVMLMLGVPASVAGCPSICVVTPPNKQGKADPAVLHAASKCGITEVYKMAGAHAIAALAYGTASVPRVDKVVGPGSIYATAAKRILAGVVDVGLPAGPSESIILADEHADPAIAGLDLLIEAEHGADSAALLVTHSVDLAEKAAKAIEGYLPNIPEPRQTYIRTVLGNYGGIVLTESFEQSCDFVNDYAPEHLEIQAKDPFLALSRIKHAGEILLGPYTPISIANYCLGLNAILPTGRFARSYSAVTVHDFIKRSGIGYMDERGYEKLSGYTATLADYEGFPSHAFAIRERAKIWKDKKP
ncbi:putative histidinol dehydrogenase 2 [Bryobacterales bacterium F-183]|nr:putative histidinol dehydrogenase 2 [Bryobacterales bacterium F-183]